MAVEVEKKYRFTRAAQEDLRGRLRAAGAVCEGAEFEENTLYRGGALDTKHCVLRLRRVDGRGVLTYKERHPTETAAIKRHREDETTVGDAEAMHAILSALGYRPSLVYEKRRVTWQLGRVEVVLDELPFGYFVEIEGPEDAIIEAEQLLHLSDAPAEHETYPHLTDRHGTRRGDLVEARFEK